VKKLNKVSNLFLDRQGNIPIHWYQTVFMKKIIFFFKYGYLIGRKNWLDTKV